MAYEQKELSGVLFRNDKKTTEKQPTHTGNCLIDGVAYWISAWVKEDKNKNKFFSMAFKAKDAPRGEVQQDYEKESSENDIPF